MTSTKVTNTSFVGWPTFEEMKEMFKEHFVMDRREDGVVTVRMHTNNGPVAWSMETHDAIGKMWRLLGTDRDTEMIIYTGTGKLWISDFESASWAQESHDPAGARYDHMYIDGRRMIIAMIHDVEVPTLGVLNGSGGHTELGLMCDLAIAADDIVILDPHMISANAPGDGIQDCFIQLMPFRQAVWYLMTSDTMTAEQMLQFGLVSELVPREKLMDRAYEIADILMAQSRIVRRLATQMVRRPWKQRIVDDLDGAFGMENFGMFCVDASHNHTALPLMTEHLGIKDPGFTAKTR